MKRKKMVLMSLSSGTSEKPFRINSVTIVSFVIPSQVMKSSSQRIFKMDMVFVIVSAKHMLTNWSIKIVKSKSVSLHSSRIPLTFLFLFSLALSLVSLSNNRL